jgi:hypothetical protein
MTERRAALFKNSRMRQPAELVMSTTNLAEIGPFNETVGDFWVGFQGTRYEMEGISTAETFRMRRLIASKHG